MPEQLTRRALNRALLARQGLLERRKATPISMVEQLAGLQAQQARPPFVGLWSRLMNFERGQVKQSIEKGELVRALFWRGTLHLISAADFYAFRDSLQPMLTAGMQSVLGDRVTTFDPDRVLAAAEAMFIERPRTFTELRAGLIEAFPEADERAMGYFVRTHLPLVSVPEKDAGWAFSSDAEFALLTAKSRVRQGSLVRRYLAAFGPATVSDFQAWCGIRSAQPLFDETPDLVTFLDERKKTVYDLPEAPRPDEKTPAPVRMIAEFDNLILGHADRSRIIAEEHRSKVTTKNLLVLGTFLVDGFVAGIWKVERKKKAVAMTLTPFIKLTATIRKELTREAEELAVFVEPDAASHEVHFA